MEDRWLPVDEIAAYLGIKRDMVYKEEQGPAQRVVCLWKFRKEGVGEWLKREGPTTTVKMITGGLGTDDNVR